jgi:N,N-dimethylformamidase
MGFDLARPFERLPASTRPEVAFVFEGIESETIGAHGPHGGVVFQEWDNAYGSTATIAPLVLARSSSHSVATRWFGAVKRRNHADMTFTSNEAGGAIFSASSMGWALALQSNGGENDVARITSNVIRRFLRPEPFDPPIAG